MSDYRSIINEIQARLSGNAEKDVAFLRESARNLRDDEDGLAVRREIARWILKIAPRSKTRDWRRGFRELSESFDAKLRSAQNWVENRRFEEALDLLVPLAAKVDGLFDDDARTEYRRFRNPLEEAICDRFFSSGKERRRAPIDYPRLYLLFGSALYEKRRTSESKRVLKKGLAFNPIDVELLFQQGEANRRERNDREYLRTTTDALRYSYRPKDLARGYRNLGAFYVEAGRFDLARNLYFFSLTFDDDSTTRRELRFLESQTRRRAKAPPFETIRRSFDQEEIQLGPDPNVVAAAKELGERARRENDSTLARDCFDVVFRLTNDSAAKKVRDEL